MSTMSAGRIVLRPTNVIMVIAISVGMESRTLSKMYFCTL